MLPRPVTALAERQQGVLTRPQLLSMGCSPGAIAGWVRREHLVRVLLDGVPLVGTYRVRGSPVTARQLAFAAAARCRPKALLTGPVMLGALGVEGFDWSSPIMVRVPCQRQVTGVPFRVLHDQQVHRDSLTLDGIWGSSATRAINDAALLVTGKPLITAVDSAKWQRLTSNASLRECAELLAPTGHEGAATILELLEGDLLRQESHGERAMAPVLRQLPVPVRWQVWISAGIRVDAAVDGVPLAVEYLGRKDHAPALKQAQDAERHREIRALGWHVIYVVAADLREPAALLARILGVREGLLAARIRVA